MGFQPVSHAHMTRSLAAVHRSNDAAKKREYNARVMHVELGTVTPLVFSSLGGMSVECSKFYSRLNEMLAAKRDVSLSVSMCFLRVQLSLSLLRSALLCIGGSRSPSRTSEPIRGINFTIACTEARLSDRI